MMETDHEEMLTGHEIDMGTTPLNLAQYACESHVTEKLTVGNPQDGQLIIEISVKSRPHDQIQKVDVPQVPDPVPVI